MFHEDNLFTKRARRRRRAPRSTLSLPTVPRHAGIARATKKQDKHFNLKMSNSNSVESESCAKQLSEAISEGDEARACALLDAQPALLDAALSRDSTKQRFTPLALALAGAHMGIVRELLRRGADANKVFDDSYHGESLIESVSGPARRRPPARPISYLSILKSRPASQARPSFSPSSSSARATSPSSCARAGWTSTGSSSTALRASRRCTSRWAAAASCRCVRCWTAGRPPTST